MSRKRPLTGKKTLVTPPPGACCTSPRLTWTRTGRIEPVITCTHCGFRIDPDGILLDWLDPEEIEAAQVLEQNMPRILELATRLGLIGEEK